MPINSEERKHWVFKKHTNNINLFTEVALYLKANKAGISMDEKERMYEEFSKTEMYNPRVSLRNDPLDAINHKLDGLNYYMFGYSDTIDGRKKFIFSPLGNLFLNHLDDREALAKIFATMLFSIQFPHPASKPSEEFSLYPFRLIFSLLLDSRLDGTLYNFEVYKFLIYQDKMTPKIYEDLVSQILESRKQLDIDKFAYLKSKEHEIVKSTYEWQYYVSSLLEAIGVIHKNDGDSSIDLFHPQKLTSKSPATKRTINNGFFALTEVVKPLIIKLFNDYSIYDVPLDLGDSKRKSNDIVKEIYSFYPNALLVEIGETPDPLQMQLLELPKLIEEYSQNPKNQTADKFEDVLEDTFNMFVNVEAQKLSGAGRTDIECLYLTINEKFAVEAKSTANKLSGINAGRLKRHRDLIGANYTIVVTPRYVPSVKYDIVGQKIVIIKANTLSEYLYNNIVANNRNIDYAEIQEIVVNNLGKDISADVSGLTLTKFG
ncbi:TPA: restriction endonuclease [Listeria monocytogenes]|nr:restriction endonuclease [Listeria monocytogenes]EHC6224156.1 restriction endonuclease [Listeria monocytogenes serotype 1/2a]EAD2920009.1 restriction endonuclease [Listeria monocytogenes]EAG0263305.1 restriction endonuclease [Listeria monocytogenes]EHG1783054.1 restriction endonuclease [Listeria monocytogenes]